MSLGLSDGGWAVSARLHQSEVERVWKGFEDVHDALNDGAHSRL